MDGQKGPLTLTVDSNPDRNRTNSHRKDPKGSPSQNVRPRGHCLEGKPTSLGAPGIATNGAIGRYEGRGSWSYYERNQVRYERNKGPLGRQVEVWGANEPGDG